MALRFNSMGNHVSVFVYEFACTKGECSDKARTLAESCCTLHTLAQWFGQDLLEAILPNFLDIHQL